MNGAMDLNAFYDAGFDRHRAALGGALERELGLI
jgi:hypothetical protein